MILALAAARGDDPKPPWQRRLAGDDARKAAELEKRIAELENAVRYAEAIPAAEGLLALRTNVQGADHWETRLQQGRLTELRKLAALPEEKQRAWYKAEQGVVEAATLEKNARYTEALPLRRERLTWCREVLGEEHFDTATAYHNVALDLNSLGSFGEAGPLYQRALEIYRKTLGEDHPYTARSYSGVADSLRALGRYVQAETLYCKALDIHRRVLGDEDPDTARSCNALANSLDSQGRYGEAGPLLHKALEIRRRALGEEHRDTATSYNDVAGNLLYQGRYAEAEELFRMALEIRRRVLGENHRVTAQGYNNLARALDLEGRHAEAGPLYRKALDVYRQAVGENHVLTIPFLTNLAVNLSARKEYAEAGRMLQQALDVRRQALGESHPDTANSYLHLAANVFAQGRPAEAEPLYRKALEARRRTLGEDHPSTAQSYCTLASNLHAQGKHPEALALLVRSSRSYEAARVGVAAQGLERAAYGAERSPYAMLAAAYGRAGQAAAAWDAVEADLGRGLLDDTSLRWGTGLTPAEQQQRDELGTRRSALDARVLVLATRRTPTEAEAAELRRRIEERQGLDETLADLVAIVSRREVAGLPQLQAALPEDAAFVAWIDGSGPWDVGPPAEHWGCVVRSRGEPQWQRLPGSGPGGEWTEGDSDLPERFRKALAAAAPAAEADGLARRLSGQRLAPLDRHLDGVRRLFVAPVNRMAGIPVEALTDRYTVSYTPSGTYLARLRDRPRPRSTGLLAVGDPVFPPARPVAPSAAALPPGGLLITQVLPGGAAANARLQAGDVLVAYAGQDLTSPEQFRQLAAARAAEKAVIAKVWREGQDKLTERELPPGKLGVILAKEPAREALTARRQADHLLAKLSRGEQYAELPGTQVEVARLAEFFEARNVTTLTRAAASEQRLDELRRAGTLNQYRFLHFATHGKANDVRAFESALILTPPTKLPEVGVGQPYLEGRLTAGEVLEYWKLDCELVTLSACESGLGRSGGGDGLLGFAQAFLVAGSRSVCLTLWQVDDTATALLMDRFYRNLLGKRLDGGKQLGKAAALREAKDWLRTLTAAEALDRLGRLTQGVVRGERPARQEMQAVPGPKDAGKDYRPYAHPRYWAAFILIGDPE
jgi:tetratricopeptide (TPR) repeat protein